MTSASAKDLAERLLTMARISDAPGYVHLGAPAAMREAAALLTRYAEGKGPDDHTPEEET